MPSSLQREPGRIHLGYLDGVRAVGALYISLFHAAITAVWGGSHGPFAAGLSDTTNRAVRLLLFGHYTVSVFIILSGYCLMLPVAKQRDLRLPGGIGAFLWRRVRRIVPPYYAAMCLSLLVCLIPGLNHTTGARWDQALPAWSRGVIISHLLLVQNWSPAWYLKIDMPAWTVAVEWQIYWMFPFLLLPLARRLGVVATAVLTLIIGGAVHLLIRGGTYDYVYLSYVGSFALGMVGATISFSENARARFAREKIPWAALNVVAWAAVFGIAVVLGPFVIEETCWWTDPLVGFATFCLLIFCTRAVAAPRPLKPPLILRVLQLGWLCRLGGFSYSYYLVHDPIENLLRLALQPFAFSATTILCLMLGLSLPLTVSGGYLFHLIFELPFMSAPGKSVVKEAQTDGLTSVPGLAPG